MIRALWWAVLRTFRTVLELKLSDNHGPLWAIEIPAVTGCDSYGRSLVEARRTIREVLAVALPDGDAAQVARTATLEEELRLPSSLRAALQRWQRARARTAKLDAAIADARAAEAAAAREVTDRLSLRDAGELLGLSQEGVRKLVKGGPGVRKANLASNAERTEPASPGRSSRA